MNKLLVILFICFSNITFPCSCVGKSRIKKEIQKADVLFSGKILAKNVFAIKNEYVPEEFYIRKAEYIILVTKKYKGKIVNDTLKIITGLGNGDCGFEFLIGHTYIIYASYSDKYYESGERVARFLNTDVCTRTKPYNEIENRKIEKYIKRKKLS